MRYLSVLLAWALIACGQTSDGGGQMIAGTAGAPATTGGAGGVSSNTGGSAGSPALPPDCVDVPGTDKLQLLPPLDLNRTLTAVFGPGPLLEASDAALLQNPVVTPAFAAELQIVARERAAAIAAALPCVEDDECVRSELERVGLLLYRRPLTEGDVARLLELFEANRTQATLEESYAVVLEAMLQSPHLLYWIGLGTTPQSASAAPLEPFALASRLSYFLWRAPPDPELYEAAASGGLLEPEGIEAQTRRLLAHPEADFGIVRLHFEWLDLLELGVNTPDIPSDLALAMKRETELFVADLFDAIPTLGALLTSSHSFLDATLAAHYGISGVSGAFQRVELDARFSSLLTQGALMVNHPTPTTRGVFVQRAFRCADVPAPPPDIEFELPDMPTRREQYEAAMTDPVCAGCHQMLDPIGFGLEGFDAMAKPQPARVDGLITLDGMTHEFDGPRQLAQLIADSADAIRCVTQRWTEYALRRPLEPAELAAIECMAAERGANFDLRDVLVGIATSNVFRTTPPVPEAVPPPAQDTTTALDHVEAEIAELRARIGVEQAIVLLDAHREALQELRRSAE